MTTLIIDHNARSTARAANPTDAISFVEHAYGDDATSTLDVVIEGLGYTYRGLTVDQALIALVDAEYTLATAATATAVVAA